MNDKRLLMEGLRNGEVVELEGCRFTKAEGPIRKGDWYVAARNTGPYLLTASSFTRYHGSKQDSEDLPTSEGASWINPVEQAYPFDVHECIKVKEVE